jgi:hypothetical protein
MGNNRIKPSILSIKDYKFSGPDDPVPGSWYTEIMNAEGFGGFGLYFMEPGSQTTTFSLESEDDKTADEYGCWERGWKYSAKNTGAIPASFFWGLGEPPEGVKRRMLGF